MITIPLINWQPITSMPDDRKDGRPMLLWDDGRPIIGCWLKFGGSWEWAEQQEFMTIDNPTYWADINPPE